MWNFDNEQQLGVNNATKTGDVLSLLEHITTCGLKTTLTTVSSAIPASNILASLASKWSSPTMTSTPVVRKVNCSQLTCPSLIWCFSSWPVVSGVTSRTRSSALKYVAPWPHGKTDLLVGQRAWLASKDWVYRRGRICGGIPTAVQVSTTAILPERIDKHPSTPVTHVHDLTLTCAVTLSFGPDLPDFLLAFVLTLEEGEPPVRARFGPGPGAWVRVWDCHVGLPRNGQGWSGESGQAAVRWQSQTGRAWGGCALGTHRCSSTRGDRKKSTWFFKVTF